MLLQSHMASFPSHPALLLPSNSLNNTHTNTFNPPPLPHGAPDHRRRAAVSHRQQSSISPDFRAGLCASIYGTLA